MRLKRSTRLALREAVHALIWTVITLAMIAVFMASLKLYIDTTDHPIHGGNYGAQAPARDQR